MNERCQNPKRGALRTLSGETALLWDEERVMKLDWTRGGLAEGLGCYRARKFFDAHEHWEGVWLRLQEPEKTFLQALIQVAAAFHHLQRGNPRGTASLLRTALRRLEGYADSFEGVWVAPLRGDIRDWLNLLEAGDGPFRHSFPEIRLCG